MIKKFFALLAVIMITTSSVDGMAATIETCFTPGQDCQSFIVSKISDANKEIFVQAYSFTSAPIASALVAAKRRGVDVRVILDKSQETDKYGVADYLLNGGVTVGIDKKHAIAHNKVIIIDQSDQANAKVIGGSYNYTKAAEEQNAENVTCINDPKIVQRFVDNWKLHASHSEQYFGRK